MLASGKLGQGARVEQFERAMASFTGGAGAVATSNGTAALHLALLALGVGKGDVVLLPSYVCTAVLNAVSYTGAAARLVDIDPRDFNCDPSDVRRRCSRKVRAIIVPHLFGQAARIREVLSLGIPVIEDCSQSVGARVRGKRVGSFGDLAVFSFYATKVLATGEGGMVVGRSRRLIARVRDFRQYDERSDYRPRYNYKMTDVEAALGLAQLRKLPRFLSRRRQLARSYNRLLAGSGVELPCDEPERPHSYYRYVVKVTGSVRKTAAALGRAGVEAKPPVFRPLHRYLGLDPHKFPGSEEAARHALSLPIYPLLTEREVERVVRVLARVCGGGGKN